MSTLQFTVRDSMTMLRRNLLYVHRYPVVLMSVIGIPVILLLLFVFVFGNTLGAGLGGVDGAGGGSRAVYLAYVVPGILVMGIAGGAQGIAIGVAMDMTEGIIARFRTMAISRAAVLNGHVFGSVAQTLLGLAVVAGVALGIGFRPSAGPLQWLAVVGLTALITHALTWLSVALGMFAMTVESAGNLPLPLILLPFLGSGFVPAGSMPAARRWFADYQPFTPFINAVRELLMGTPMGSSGWLSIAWCVAIGPGSYLWAASLYNRKTLR